MFSGIATIVFVSAALFLLSIIFQGVQALRFLERLDTIERLLRNYENAYSAAVNLACDNFGASSKSVENHLIEIQRLLSTKRQIMQGCRGITLRALLFPYNRRKLVSALSAPVGIEGISWSAQVDERLAAITTYFSDRHPKISDRNRINRDRDIQTIKQNVALFLAVGNGTKIQTLT